MVNYLFSLSIIKINTHTSLSSSRCLFYFTFGHLKLILTRFNITPLEKKIR
jgi:hypothetical protein